MPCLHPNMRDTAHMEWCPDCGYKFYYDDDYTANSEDQQSKLINAGDDSEYTFQLIVEEKNNNVCQ